MGEAYFVVCRDVHKSLKEIGRDGLGAVLVDFDFALCGKKLEAAYELARMAFESGTNVAVDLNGEILLFLSCRTHVKSAIEAAGAKNGKKAVLFVYGKRGGLEFDKLGIEKADGAFEKIDEGKVKKEIERMALSRA
ncbi:MAG: KEOPS complex subunit Cgi121 [Candidatus Micrarchaeota archaeon]